MFGRGDGEGEGRVVRGGGVGVGGPSQCITGKRGWRLRPWEALALVTETMPYKRIYSDKAEICKHT